MAAAKLWRDEAAERLDILAGWYPDTDTVRRAPGFEVSHLPVAFWRNRVADKKASSQ
jgi:hypothetical protein